MHEVQTRSSIYKVSTFFVPGTQVTLDNQAGIKIQVMKKSRKKFLLLVVAAVFVLAQSVAQDSKKPKIDKALFKDTLDNKFDFSRVLGDAHGFLPIVFIITEPAFGGFGGGIAPLFLSPKKNLPPGYEYVAPDITRGLRCIPSMVIGRRYIRSILFPKGSEVQRALFTTSMNLDFYRTLAEAVRRNTALI
jgi:hypothetical protein